MEWSIFAEGVPLKGMVEFELEPKAHLDDIHHLEDDGAPVVAGPSGDQGRGVGASSDMRWTSSI